MNIWIITIGNSDVQLWTKDHWTNLYRTVRSQLGDRGFTPTEGTDDRFLVPGRVMGTVYGQSQAQDYWHDLAFPLLDNFVGLVQHENIKIDQIILILTDQEVVFSRSQRRSTQSAYWQDTCTLEPIVATYLKDKLPQAQLKSLLLQPQSPTEGLDDWDSVLKLIKSELAQLDFPDSATIYVSHQASTPAISSAVQFETLLRFGHRVQFLVTSERDKELTKILNRSTYLRGIRQQEAKTLLERYDYSGVKALLAPYLKPDVEILLDAAIQWNSAKFDDFAKRLLDYPDNQLRQAVQERTKEDNWWWTAYEAAYLGVVRLEQGNTVEALFHSFRAVEGLIAAWAKFKYPQYVKEEKDKYGKKALFVKREIQEKMPEYRKKDFPKKTRIKLYSQSLYDLLQEDKKTWKQNGDIKVFLNDARDERNKLFHKVLGLKRDEVYQAWGIRTPETNPTELDLQKADKSWQDRVLGCLNFVSGKTFKFLDKPESDGTVASLMAKVYQKLRDEISGSAFKP